MLDTLETQMVFDDEDAWNIYKSGQLNMDLATQLSFLFHKDLTHSSPLMLKKMSLAHTSFFFEERISVSLKNVISAELLNLSSLCHQGC